MMKNLTALWAIVLLSCGQGEINPEINTTGDTASSMVNTLAVDTISLRFNNEEGSGIYDKYIAPQLKDYLDKDFKGWTVPAPNRWDTLWFKQYRSDSTLVNYISGDFDCNTKKDYALLFIKANGNIAAYAFLSAGKTLKAVELIDFGKDSGGQIELGLEVLPPGDYNHIDPDSEEDPLPIKIRCNSVQVVNFERAAETFYWEKGKLRSVITGD